MSEVVFFLMGGMIGTAVTGLACLWYFVRHEAKQHPECLRGHSHDQ